MKRLDLKTSTKKIDSPLAKYNSAGQLFCVLCNSPVKSEIFWTGHINGRGHQDALNSLKAKKRPGGSDDGPSPKKKPLAISSSHVSSSSSATTEITPFKVPFPVSASPSIPSRVIESPTPPLENRIVSKMDVEEEEVEENDEETSEAESNSNGINLPEGFFDDPKADAKIRGKEWRDPDELEWEKFTKEIANEELKSANLRSQDDEDSTKTRELEEIEEQMAHWQKVIDLERKAETMKQSRLKQGPNHTSDEEEEADDYDEEMDWRSKRH